MQTHTVRTWAHVGFGELLRMEYGFVSVNLYNFIREMFLIIAISNNLKINNSNKSNKKKTIRACHAIVVH